MRLVLSSKLSAALALTTCVALVSGCYTWEPIRPSELPKLSGGGVTVGRIVDGENEGRVVVASLRHVEAPDGTMVEIKGKYDARITLKNGREIEFEHPVRTEVDGLHVVIAGGNVSNMSFDPDNIKSVEVSQFSAGQTALAIVGCVVLSSVITVVALSSSTSH